MNIVTVIPGIEGAIDLSTGCINWRGSKLKNGYGRKWLDGKTVLVHRLVLESKITGFLDSGYFACHTCDNPKGKQATVTRAVLAEKLGYEIPIYMDACHTCDNPSCINPEHLWAGTRTQNLLDASKKGRTQGKSHPLSNAKLDREKVREIRQRLAAGERMKDLAKEYGVGWGAIHNIKYHVTWKEEGEEVPIPRRGGYLDRSLTFAQAQEVRERIKKGESIAKIARELGVSNNVISDIKNYVTYKKE
ncbi:MAG: hypothetical protein HC849_15905 [Oscillatoriales cyanobacterium RU_3_3]|nr:hypothetical protein [Oscillatoriales cyanobacterium RU_3_3]